MISQAQVIALLEEAAERRFESNWKKRFSPEVKPKTLEFQASPPSGGLSGEKP